MCNFKTVLFFIVSILLSFSVQSQTVQQRTEKLRSENYNAVFRQGSVDMARQQGVPANIDSQIRKFILEKFGGLEVQQNGDIVERHLNLNVSVEQKNVYGRKYNNFDYYTYKFSSYVQLRGTSGQLKSSSSYEFVLEAIMKQNGEINEYKWNERKTK
jgi:hypothetical protein